MGLLRFLLALVVVSHHLPAHLGVPAYRPIAGHLDAMVAVLIFYILSGFYMSLVINTKYAFAPWPKTTFYAARALRIFPLYWTCLAVVTIYFLIWGKWDALTNILALPSAWQQLAQVFMNVTTLGLDLAPSLGGYAFQLIAPAWSLGTELLFYLCAPWLVRLTLGQCLALSGTLFAIRYGYMINGSDRYPMRVLFFPLSLAFFLLGHAGYLLVERIRAVELDVWVRRRGRWLGPVLILSLLVGAELLHVGRYVDPDVPNMLMFYVLLVACVPVLFLATADSRVDGFLGDASFPLYVSHVITLAVIANHWSGGLDAAQLQKIGVGVSVLVAGLLTIAVERPLEQWRKRVIERLRGRGIIAPKVA